MNTWPSIPQLVPFGIVVLYLISVLVLSNRLKQHPEAWERAGRFLLITNNSLSSGWKFLQFVISDSHKALNDRPLTYMLWTTRALFTMACAVILWNFVAVAGQ